VLLCTSSSTKRDVSDSKNVVAFCVVIRLISPSHVQPVMENYVHDDTNTYHLSSALRSLSCIAVRFRIPIAYMFLCGSPRSLFARLIAHAWMASVARIASSMS
jgi:hypothetical protein